MNKLILATPLFLLLFIGVAGAASPTIPSGIQYYVPINLTNAQTTATPAPFQQMLTANELNYASYITYNGVSANFELFYANGTIVPSWIESNSSSILTIWAKTISIPASSHIQIYLGFANKTTNLLSSSGTSGIGEAPQLSPAYAEYDDGADVFSFYDNFAGTTLNTEWTVSGITYSVNNGFSATATGIDGYIISKAVTINPATNIIDFYGTNFQTNVDWTAVGALDGGETTATSGGGLGSMIIAGSPTASQTNGWQRNSAGITNSGAMQTVSAPAVWTIEPTSSTATNFYINYGGVQTVSADADTYPLYEGLISAGGGAVAYTFSEAVTIQWYRVRAYPPNGVMPSVTFGAVQSALALSISPNPATYGQSITLTASGASTDNICIDYPSVGDELACGTGSASYTYNAFALAAGTYASYYGVDTTQGTNTTAQTLTINKAPVSPSCSFAGTTIANATTQQTLNTQNYLNCTLTNHNDQLAVNLYYNSTSVASGASVSYLTKFDNYNNSFTYNTIGNSNYTAGSFIGHIDYLLYKLISATNFGAHAYETATVNPQYTLNITKAASWSLWLVSVQFR